MIVKISISFLNDDNDADLIVSTNGIITALTGNASFANPVPTLAEITTSLGIFTTAVSEAAGGGVALTAARNDKREALATLLRDLAAWVQLNCGGDLAILLTSGFPTQKPTRQPVGELHPPSNLQVKLGIRSGQLISKADPVPGASIYNWRVTNAAQTNPTFTAQTTGARHTFSGLTPGVIYSVVVNAVGAAGPSNWSSPATQMVV